MLDMTVYKALTLLFVVNLVLLFIDLVMLDSCAFVDIAFMCSASLGADLYEVLQSLET